MSDASTKRPPAKDNVPAEVVEKIQARFGKDIERATWHMGQCSLLVTADKVHDMIEWLRDDLGFDMLSDLTAVDYSEWPQEDEYAERFCLVYNLVCIERNERIRLQACVSELEPKIATISDLYGNANWLEREVYDFFGIQFEGHPNLTRIQCPENMKGYPLRKDYPLTGRGEREDFPVYHDDQP